MGRAGAALEGWGAALVVLVTALSRLPRRLLVQVGLRGPDCPEGVHMPRLLREASSDSSDPRGEPAQE